MDVGRISRGLLLGICLIAGKEVAALDMPDFYSEPGLNQNRSLNQSTDFDAVDPFSGKLQLHQTDIFIPGNGGMNLEVGRSYTSSIGDNGFGYGGWTMDFGYVEARTLFALCTTGIFVSNVNNPVLVLPDGSRQVLADVDLNFPPAPDTYTFPYITNKFWKASCMPAPQSGLIVTSPEGKIYEMTFGAGYTAPNLVSYTRWYVTKITDRNGNWIGITYKNPQANGAIVDTITTSDGRTLQYSYTPPDANGLMQLASVSDGTRTWRYSYIDGSTIGLSVGSFLLNKVTLPDNTTWEYTYNGNLGVNNDPALYGGNAIIPGSYLIKSVKTPQGGVVNYQYDYVQFNSGGGYEVGVTLRSVVGGGTWAYTYTPSTGQGVLDKTTVVITDPVSGVRTDTYSHFGYNTIAPYNEIWKIGLLAQKTIGTKQIENYTWGVSSVTNRQTNVRKYAWTTKLDYGLYYPVLLSKTVVRDGATYSTTYNNIDFFANAWGTTELGPTGASRTKTFNYSVTSYNDPKWILHQKTYEFYNGLNHIQILDTNNNVLFDSRALVTTAYTYNPDGTVATTTPPGGATYTYDMYGTPTSSTAPHGTSYSDYMRGIPQAEIQQDGISISRIVNSAGDVTSETNGNSHTTNYTYDDLNRLTSISYPINNPVNIGYTSNSKTATRGALVESTIYDGFGRPTSVTLGGITTTYQYDALGRMTFKSNPNSTSGTSYAYDDLGRVTKVTNADGSWKSTAYGPLTRTVTDENGHITTYTYYAYGDPDQTYLTSITTPDPASNVSITRDALDNVSSVKQANITRGYVFGPNGYLYQQTDPETGITNYGRDDAGNMTSRAVGGGIGWVMYSYDYHNRLTSVNTQSSLTTNTYSNTNKLLSAEFSGGYISGGYLYGLTPSTHSFTYDENDNMVTDSLLVDGYNLTTGYAYNSNDQISSITYPISNQIVSFTPDVLGKPTAVSGYVNNATYWPSGQVHQISYQNGAISNYEQNSRLWPSTFSTQSSAGSLIDSSYLYDSVGNLNSISDTTTPAFNRTFSYDQLDRLTTINASGSWGNGTIGYDGAGNIISQTFGSLGMTYNYSLNNQLDSVLGTLRNAHYTYNYFGSVLSDGAGKSFTYDEKSTLVQVNDTNSGALTMYNYDGMNKRMKVQKNGVLTYELYDLSGKLLEEYTPSQSNKLTEYMYLGGMRIAQRTSNH